jgi:hypothetical protein
MVVGLYAWTATVAFGAVLVDVVYAAQASTGATSVPGEAADLQLGVVAVTLLMAIGAVAVSWDRRPARDPLLASLVVVVAALVTPLVLSGPVGDAEAALGVRIGPWLRLGVAGLASVLAFVGVRGAWRST